DLKNIPEEVLNSRIVDIAVGSDHITALDESGKLHTWGSTRLKQDRYPRELKERMDAGEKIRFKSLTAGIQFTVGVVEDGELYVWGNTNLNDIKISRDYKDTKFQKATANINNFLALTEDGAAVYIGRQKNALSRIPEGLDKDVVDIASTAFSNAAVKADGTVYIWGNAMRGEREVPEHEGKIIKIYGGRNHYTALTDQNELISWGDGRYNQNKAPNVGDDKVVDIFVGNYQNYVLTESGEMKTWGLKGFLFGTDEYGRDIFKRIINGGKVTMTVGAVAVLISLFIGVLLGGLAGYFGGWTDIIIMRIAEIVGGLPFLPFALILSAIIGTRISPEQRMYLIMIVLGVLSWPGLCRLVRAQIFAQREMEFVTAAQALGLKEVSIVFKHIIPNVISVILVSATLSFATSMLTESTLSYLGFGISPPKPTWGNMLKGANDSIVIQQYWWRWVFTSLIFSICTICINLIGDGLRDAIDPKSNER
ncbi:MAG: ABC transporter permease subunit, partial [Eubacteriales bacterium]|nr:ABC transporter permease subunit [Eubacteriales bacterium]